MKKWLKRVAFVLCAGILLGGCMAYWAVQQTQYVPDFYREATGSLFDVDVAVQRKLISRRLSNRVQQIQSQARLRGTWKADFSNEEINAWLAEELPTMFPNLLRRGISHPRVAIQDGKLMAAARLRNKRIDTVISCEVSIELTEQANLLAIRWENLRAGALSLPWSQFLDRISREAAIGDISVQWDMTDRGPVALLSVPKEHPKFVVHPVVVESIGLSDGVFTLAGNSGETAETDYSPRTNVHRFVSFDPQRLHSNDRRQAMLDRSGEPASRMR